ncbi:ATPase [Promicromonospora sp. NPDC050880]|uniref:ATPase n=1 Tax=Promicromonospora sp. NPDC050880 TaxID=3364406 RepID=UPI0037A7DF35
MSSDTVPRWPRIDAVVREDGSGEVTIDGTFHPISAASLEEARVEVLRRVTENAARVGRPVRASATGPEGLWNLIVHPDGTVVPEEDELAPPSAPTPQAPPAGSVPDQVPGQAPGPVFDDASAADLPTREPLPGAHDGPSADPLASAVEIDPDDTVRRVPAPGPAPDLGPRPDLAPRPDLTPGPADAPGAADRLGESAADRDLVAPAADPGVDPGALPGTVPGDMAGHHAAGPASGPLDTVPGPAGPLDTVPVPSGPVDAVPSGAGAPAAPADTGRTSGTEAPRSRREARESFLTHQQDEDPATRGFRGVLTRLGIRVGPSESERAERADERAVSQHWPGPRTISMVNGKGGAGKTPSTVLLAAVFAQFGGAGVVTWDNNQTRGTLGWRTEQGPHESTLLDLLPQTDRLLGPSAQAADLARYVHHQTRDRFDVLRSKPIAMANEQRIEPQDVDAIHSVLSKYYRMILIDSGNDESDPMWQRMIDLTDQLVVATTTRDDHAEAGALLLEALSTRDGRSAYLAQQAVVVVSQADQKQPASELERVADGYRSLAREVVTIPFDPAMVDGHLRYGALRPDTRRAWLAAGAAVAGGL